MITGNRIVANSLIVIFHNFNIQNKRLSETVSDNVSGENSNEFMKMVRRRVEV